MLSRQRYVIVGIIALAAIVALPLAHALQTLWVVVGWDDMPLLGRELPLTAVLAYGAAAAGAIFALKHQHTYQLATEVVDELSKVTWPSRDETSSATVVVIVTVIVCSAFLGIFDFVWLKVTDWMLGIEKVLPS